MAGSGKTAIHPLWRIGLDMHLRYTKAIGPLLIATLLTACGGSGSGSGTNTSGLTAEAGPNRSVPTDTTVTLDGSASASATGAPLSYRWSLQSGPPGSTASLDDPDTVAPSFSADREGTYTLTLIVRDGASSSPSDTVFVWSSRSNAVPVADAGPDQNVATGSLVTLQGDASGDTNGDALTYAWRLVTVPDGSVAELIESATVSPTFVADRDGSYVAELVVQDGIEASQPVTSTIVATTQNAVPVATAGDDRELAVGAVVTLDGSASTDADGESLTYEWAFVSVPDGSMASLDEPAGATPSFTADVAGSYVLSLGVSDAGATSALDNVRIEAILPSVELLRESDGFFSAGGFNPTAFPYASNSTSSVSVTAVPAPTTYALDSFRLRAKGGSFTIEGLSATDATSQVAPYFTNLVEGYVIADGEEVDFELVSPLTRGAQVSLQFSFTVRETGEQFVSSYTFSSN